MAHTKVWTPALSSGQQITAAKLSTLQDEHALTIREGTNTLASDLDLDLAAKNFTFDASGAGRARFGTQYPAIRDITFTDWHAPGIAYYNPSDWTAASFGAWPSAVGMWACTEVAAYSPIDFVVYLPVGIEITSVTATVLGDSTGAPGATKPAISFYYCTVAAPGTAVAIGDQEDPSATELAYEAIHTITKSGLTHTVAAGRIYHVAVRNGYGATHNSLRLYGITFSGNVNALRVVLWP
jgi:hypothetical protein